MRKLFLIFGILGCINVYAQIEDTGSSKKSLTELKDTSYSCTVVLNSRSVYKDVKLFGLKDSTVNILKDEKSSTE